MAVDDPTQPFDNQSEEQKALIAALRQIAETLSQVVKKEADGTRSLVMALGSTLSGLTAGGDLKGTYPSPALAAAIATAIVWSGTIEFSGTLNHSGALLGLLGANPTVVQTGYTAFANLVTDRTLDADATSTAELADVLGTLIEDLKTKGIIKA